MLYHSHKTNGGPEASSTDTIIRKCGVNTNLGGQKSYILKALWSFHTHGSLSTYLMLNTVLTNTTKSV